MYYKLLPIVMCVFCAMYGAEKMTAQEAKKIFAHGKDVSFPLRIFSECEKDPTQNCLILACYIQEARKHRNAQNEYFDLKNKREKLPKELNVATDKRFEKAKKEYPGMQSYWRSLHEKKRKIIGNSIEKILIEKNIGTYCWTEETRRIYYNELNRPTPCNWWE